MQRSIYDDLFLTPITTEGLMAFEKHVLPKALAGDYEALTTVFFICSRAVEQNCPLPPELTKFVSTALFAMARGEAASEAWHIQRRRGRKDTRLAYSKACTYALMVESLRHEQGITVEKAIAIVAEKQATSPGSVKRGWETHRKKVRKNEDGYLTMWTGPDEIESS